VLKSAKFPLPLSLRLKINSKEEKGEAKYKKIVVYKEKKQSNTRIWH